MIQVGPRASAHRSSSTARPQGLIRRHAGFRVYAADHRRRGPVRPTTSADRPFLVSFFTNPAVYDVWDGHPLEASDIEAKYLGGRSPDVECFIVQHEGRDVGFVQYHVADDGAGGGMDLSLLPEARGRRLGTAVVRALVDFVQSELGWNRFTVDPDLRNVRGVNFWKKVGFVPVRIVEGEPGREPYLLLEWPLPKAGA